MVPRFLHGLPERPTSSRTAGMNSSENTLRMSLGRVRTPGRDFLPLSGVGVGVAVNLMPTYVQWCIRIVWCSSGE